VGSILCMGQTFFSFSLISFPLQIVKVSWAFERHGNGWQYPWDWPDGQFVFIIIDNQGMEFKILYSADVLVALNVVTLLLTAVLKSLCLSFSIRTRCKRFRNVM
jgi:hypothetical protein